MSAGGVPRERLSAVDAAWYRMDERGDPADIGAVMMFDGPLDEPHVRAILAERLARHPRLRRRVVDSRHRLTSPSWEDEPGFSVEAHLETCSVVASGASDEGLASQLSIWMSQPLDFSRSPWLLRILPLADGGWALFARIHHCMGDGFALLRLLLGLADPDDAAAGAAPSRDAPAAVPPRRSPRAVVSEVSRHLVALGRLLFLSRDASTPLRAPLTGVRRLAWSPPIPLDTVKRIARSRGLTVNDVLVGALSGALRRWLAERGAAPPVRAIVPVNLRPPESPLAAAEGNWFGLVFLDVPTDVAERPARMMAVHRAMNRLKETREAPVSLALLAAIGRSPAFVDHVVEGIFSRKASVVITNVPGPRRPLRVAGAELRDMWFWVPHPCGLGLGASILSYAGNVRVGIRADVATVPDPAELARWFVEELDEGERPCSR